MTHVNRETLTAYVNREFDRRYPVWYGERSEHPCYMELVQEIADYLEDQEREQRREQAN